MHYPSVSWHIIPMKFSSWNICFRQKEPIRVQFFRLLNALVKVHPISHAIFENTRSGFIHILHYCSVLWKIIPLYFCSTNLVLLWTKRAHRKEIFRFWVVGSKFTKFLISYLKPQVSSSLNFASLFSAMRDNSFALF